MSYEDNFQCVRTEIIQFDYQDGVYVEIDNTSTFADTIQCDLRQGQEAMADADYERAIERFRRARLRFAINNDDNIRASIQSYYDYASERLIIAYALNGRLEEAEALIVEMNQTEQAEQTIAYALNQALEGGIDAVEICQTAYDTLDNIENSLYVNYRDIPQVGYINEIFYGENMKTGISMLENAACDIAKLVDTLVLDQQFTVDENPISQIEALGFTVESRFHSDLNQDGVEDWLVWIQGRQSSLHFISGESEFAVYVSQNGSHITKPSSDVWDLYPLEIASSNVRGVMAIGDYDPIDCKEGYAVDEDSSGTYYVTAWALSDSGFTHVLSGRLCYDDQEVGDYLVFDDTFTVWERGWVDSGQQVSSHEVMWNLETLSYNAIAVTVTEDTLTIPIGNIKSLIYYQNDYEEAISQVEEWLVVSEDTDKAQLLYYRGLAYQMLGQDAEALADYETVYVEAPFTIWGYLAELQLGDVE